jgi:hypothetical protein
LIEGIHIVSFDVPYPADYGGVIDVYYKAKALTEAGIKVNLHCFSYGRKHHPHLRKQFHEVHFYERRLSPRSLVSRTPFIVKTRKNRRLLNKLKKDGWPILFEGLHTCGWLDHPDLQNRKKIVRAHNIEHEYYELLADSEISLFRKQYFKAESFKLEAYEKILEHAQNILTISQGDQTYFQKRYGKSKLIYPFHAEVALHQTKDANYAFYHGNLEVPENMEAVRFLVEKVVKGTDIELVIAGKGGATHITEFQGKSSRVKFHLNPSDSEMKSLAEGAAVHVLPTFQSTGFKLKLMYSIQSNVPIVANAAMVKGTGLEELVVNAETPSEFRRAIITACKEGLGKGELERRIKLFRKRFSNLAQAKRIIELID